MCERSCQLVWIKLETPDILKAATCYKFSVLRALHFMYPFGNVRAHTSTPTRTQFVVFAHFRTERTRALAQRQCCLWVTKVKEAHFYTAALCNLIDALLPKTQLCRTHWVIHSRHLYRHTSCSQILYQHREKCADGQTQTDRQGELTHSLSAALSHFFSLFYPILELAIWLFLSLALSPCSTWSSRLARSGEETELSAQPNH